MNFGNDIVVTITGVVLVFFILVLLMTIIMIEGKIFDAITANKKAKAEAVKAAAAAARQQVVTPNPAAVAAAAAAAAPEVEEGIPGDVVAAIMAAIYTMGNGKYTLRAVRRADKSNWGKAGIQDTTSPF